MPLGREFPRQPRRFADGTTRRVHRTVHADGRTRAAKELASFVDEIDKNIVRGMITPLKEEFGVGDLGISVLLSLALLFNGLITVPAGYLADRWHRTNAIGRTVMFR